MRSAILVGGLLVVYFVAGLYLIGWADHVLGLVK